jgi:hypothetical protein
MHEYTPVDSLIHLSFFTPKYVAHECTFAETQAAHYSTKDLGYFVVGDHSPCFCRDFHSHHFLTIADSLTKNRMCPIYAVTSWFSLVFPSTEGYLAIIKDSYEAYIIYQVR